MRNDFDSEAYLSYLITHCNDVEGDGVDRVGGAAQIARHLAALELGPESRALEIGCGTGRVMEIARRAFGVLMHGCDVSRPAIDYIRRERPQFADRVFVLDDHGAQLAPSGWADAIVFWGCFELVPQRASLLECLRILKPGGRVLLSSLKHAAPFADDADAQAALAAYRAKSVPISVSDPAAFETFARALGFAIERRVVFERKADLVPDRFVVDEGGPRTFSEAFYLLRKTGGDGLDREFSTYFGPDERIAFA
jgi:SAM-dependent methyltransferase